MNSSTILFLFLSFLLISVTPVSAMEIEQFNYNYGTNDQVEESSCESLASNEYLEQYTPPNKTNINNNNNQNKDNFTYWVSSWINEATIVIGILHLISNLVIIGYYYGQYYQLTQMNIPNLDKIENIKYKISIFGYGSCLPLLLIIIGCLGYPKKIIRS